MGLTWKLDRRRTNGNMSYSAEWTLSGALTPNYLSPISFYLRPDPRPSKLELTLHSLKPPQIWCIRTRPRTEADPLTLVVKQTLGTHNRTGSAALPRLRSWETGWKWCLAHSLGSLCTSLISPASSEPTIHIKDLVANEIRLRAIPATIARLHVCRF